MKKESNQQPEREREREREREMFSYLAKELGFVKS